MKLKNSLPNYLIELAKKYDIKLIRSTEICEDNEGASAGCDEIMLGNFDNKDNEIFAFFHELAHCKFNNDMEKLLGIKAPMKLSFLSNEGLCWEYGLYLAKANGYEWSFDSEVYKYAYSRYLTYVAGEYDRASYRNEYNNASDEINKKLRLNKEGH